MLEFKRLFIVILAFTSILISISKAQSSSFEKIYNEALRYYQLKSYYSALTNLYKLTSNRENPYYVKSLYLLAKVYIKLGYKTGIKKYFNYALYYLNIYESYKKKLGWDYYYTKGYLFEGWGFYERAMFYYKTSLFLADNKEKYIDSLIGILRTAVWYNKLDLTTQYAIKLSIKDLFKNENNPEIKFLKGLLLFQEKKYNNAYKYLYETYKENEEYLIDNPEFYYIVAENMYRIKKYEFAKQLFRRIITVTQDLEVIRRSLLRLGDIEIIQKEYPSAFNHYYYLAENYPDTKEAVIAKLKIIAYSNIPEFKKRISKSNDPDLKEPVKFIVKTLVSNRNTTIGRYALVDFGEIVFKYNSKFLYQKLGWELSLLEVDRMSYEELEFFRNIWSKPLMKIKPEYLCFLFLYSSNKKLFIKAFNEDYLLSLADKMENCKKDLNIDLLQKLDNIYKDDKIKLKLAQAYYKLEKYTDSLNILNKIKDKSCSFYILISKNYVMLDQWKNLKNSASLLNNCQNKEKNLILAVYYIQNNNISKAETLIFNNMDYISKNYEKDKFYKKLLYIYAEKLISQGNYKNLLQVLSKLTETYKEDCNINSWTLIAKVRLGMVNNIDKDYEKIKECKTDWSLIAKNIYEDFLVERRLNK